ncbi:MAG TPA: FAD:protein FMN transferase [Epulopiscium sp.]|nr:FAD:protein FMN transferase [Candidatus Epulonipiscium sp.]
MNSKKQIFILFLPIMMILSSCQNKSSAELPSADKTAQLLGTVITAKAYGDNAKVALDIAFDRVQAIENRMSRYKDGSEIDLINQNAGGEAVSISPDTYFVIKTALDYAEKTNGAFNPLIGDIVDLWGIGTENASVPSADELNNFLPYIAYTQLELTENPYTAKLTSNKAKLDLGAIAKGYAADEMRDVLLEQGITSALLNLGGNVIVLGSKPGADLWSIGVQDPLAADRGDIAAVLKAKNTSVVTSGSYERFFELEGVRYHHIMDPFTGSPAQNGVISSTIITPNSTDADALSTSVYVLGKDKGLALLESLPNVEGVIITEDLHVYTTSGITDDFFTIRNEDFVYEKSR